jgi:hypothetical protein
MDIPWQIQREVARSRMEDAVRATRHAHHRADLYHRPMRTIACAAGWVADWLTHAVPVRRADSGTHAAGTRSEDLRPSDARLTVFPCDGLQDPLVIAVAVPRRDGRRDRLRSSH